MPELANLSYVIEGEFTPDPRARITLPTHLTCTYAELSLLELLQLIADLNTVATEMVESLPSGDLPDPEKD